MIFGIDENRVVRTSRHASFAADADRFVEIDDAVGALEHRGRRTSSHARSVCALVAPRYLVRAAYLRKDADIDVLNVGASDADRYNVFRFARRGARMTTDAAGVIDDLGPLDWRVSSWLWLDHTFRFETGENISRT